LDLKFEWLEDQKSGKAFQNNGNFTVNDFKLSGFGFSTANNFVTQSLFFLLSTP
jgi:hypothetical protein